MIAPADLYGRYARLYDEGRAAEFAGLFTEDAVFTASGVERARGRAAIEKWARVGIGALPGVRHLVSSVAVEIDGHGATGSAYVQAVQIFEAAIAQVTIGLYVDRFVRGDDGWLIADHRYEPFTGPALRGVPLAVALPAGNNAQQGSSQPRR